MDQSYFEQEQETGFTSMQAFKGLLPLLKPHRWRLLRNLLLLAAATALVDCRPGFAQARD